MRTDIDMGQAGISTFKNYPLDIQVARWYHTVTNHPTWVLAFWLQNILACSTHYAYF